MGEMQYSQCCKSLYISDHCKNLNACVDKILTMPQCFSCYHFKQLDTTCTIHGQLPDPRGCCGLYTKSELDYCFMGWAHKREWGLDCGWIDTIGCEECQRQFIEFSEED